MTPKTSAALVAVLLVFAGVGTAVSAPGAVQSMTDSETQPAIADAEVDAVLNNGTVTVTVTDEGDPAANVTVAADEERVGTTDANGTIAFNASEYLDEDDEAPELKLTVSADGFEGKLEYVVYNGSLVLEEEEYKYDVEIDEEAEDDESEEGDLEEDMESDDESDDDTDASEEDEQETDDDTDDDDSEDEPEEDDDEDAEEADDDDDEDEDDD